jgi:hypothetical protein
MVGRSFASCFFVLSQLDLKDVGYSTSRSHIGRTALKKRDKAPSYSIMVFDRHPSDDRTSPHEALLIFGVSCCVLRGWGNAALT